MPSSHSSEPPQGDELPAAEGADDRAAIDEFLRSDPAARTWLRNAMEADTRAALPAQPAHLSYVAQAVELIREYPDGRATLRAVLARTER
jgi:hypothetical protein